MSLTNVDHLIRSRRVATSVVLALMVALVAWGPAWAQQGQERVTIIEIDAEPYVENWRYSPAQIMVPAGTRITWFNTGRSAHTVTSPEGFFDSGPLASSTSWSYQFDTPGIYNYFCVPFPWMKGTVIVRARNDGTTLRSTATATPMPTATPTPTATPSATLSVPALDEELPAAFAP